MFSNVAYNTASRARHIQGSRKNVSLWPCVCSQRLWNVHSQFSSIGFSTTTALHSASGWLLITASCHWQTLFQHLYWTISFWPCTCFYCRIDLGSIHVLTRHTHTHTHTYIASLYYTLHGFILIIVYKYNVSRAITQSICGLERWLGKMIVKCPIFVLHAMIIRRSLLFHYIANR